MGRAFLEKEFRVFPRTAWQLDTFGHSAGVARLFAEMGCDSMVFSRISESGKKERGVSKDLEFIWRPFEGE